MSFFNFCHLTKFYHVDLARVMTVIENELSMKHWSECCVASKELGESKPSFIGPICLGVICEF